MILWEVHKDIKHEIEKTRRKLRKTSQFKDYWEGKLCGLLAAEKIVSRWRKVANK